VLPGTVGPGELLLLLLVALLLFGPAKLSKTAKSLGSGVREFLQAARPDSNDLPPHDADGYEGEPPIARDEVRLPDERDGVPAERDESESDTLAATGG
jgi:TatA/E family protein of Tat protein translocase